MLPLTDIDQIVTGNNHSCALMDSGTARCWGSNASGQLGDGTTTARRTPGSISGLSDVTALAAGGNHTCALLADETVRCWGSNNRGQLGVGDTTNRQAPVAVGGLSNVTALAAGDLHTCAVLSSGDVRCWGRNNFGQLGDSSTVDSLTPVAVHSLTDVVALAAGNTHTCALRNDGGMRCWGSNGDGQTGDGTTSTRREVPVTVIGISSATAITAGASVTCAVVALGEVRCWGSNNRGQLGNGSTDFRSPAPVLVSGVADASAVSTSSSRHTCAVVAGGVRCWGDNFRGQLGDGTSSGSRTPVSINVVGATSVVTGSNFSCARLADGQARCWGINSNGQLGNGLIVSPPSNPTVPSAGTAPGPVLQAALPGAPLAVSATVASSQANVAFNAPLSDGGSDVTGYTVTSTPGDITASGPSSPIAVVGLTNGTAYTFTVQATNSVGIGAASAASNVVTLQAAQSIIFADPGAQSFGTAPTLSATASSGLAVSFSSTTPSVCSAATGGLLTFLSVGTCIINADQAGDAAFTAAATVTQTFSVSAVAPDAPTVGVATAGDEQASVTFAAPASSGGSAITGYTVTSNPGGFTGTGGGSPITVTGLTNGVAYTFTVTATNSAGTSAASAASNSVTPRESQTITFPFIGALNFGTTRNLWATASSGLAVSFSSTSPSVCTVTTAGALTLVSVGPCEISADQAGDSVFAAAPTAFRNADVIAVAPGAPVIGTATAGDAQASLAFTAPAFTGGVAITGYTVTSVPGGLTATGATSPITVTGLTNGVAYTFTVTATTSAGTSAPSAASNSVTPQAPQTITFANPGAQTFGTTPTLSATSTSGLSVSFSSTTAGVCTVTAGGALTFVSSGTCSINADQPGNAGTAAATTVTQSFSVNAVVPSAPTIGTATAGDTQATVTFTPPTSSGGSAITAYAVTSNPGGVTGTGAGSPITVTGLTNGVAYTFAVTATTNAGTSAASAASNSVTPQASQTITFANPGAQMFGAAPALSATSTSGLPVSFSSTTTGVCTVTAGGALTLVSAGTCTIDADQPGNAGFTAASTVTRSFSVNAVLPSAPTVGTATAGDTQATITFAAPASNGGEPITAYTVTSNPGGFTGSGAGSPLTVTGLTNGVAYTFTVTATTSAGTSAASAASNNVTPQAAQTITFANPGAQNFGTTPTLTASSTSGLTVTFSSTTTGVCTITAGGALNFVAAGTCTINADQAGNAGFTAASTVTQSFSVNAVVPSAPTIGTATAGDRQATVAFTVPASDGGTAINVYAVTSNPGGITVTGNVSPITVTGLTNGIAYTFTVTATNSAGTSPPSAASTAVTPKAAQTITFADPGAQSFGTSPTLTATATSGLPVAFSSTTPSVCTITSTGTLTFVSVGTCTINADQAGDAAFAAAATVSRSFAVDAAVPGAPTIGTSTAGDTQATVSFTAPASDGGAAITNYTVTSSPGGFTGTGTASPLTVTGLTNGTAYTFTVTATNSAGSSPPSAASNAVTPQVSVVPPLLRPDRIVLVENRGAVEIDVLANDSIDPALRGQGVLSIVREPTLGRASVLEQGATGLADDVIGYLPNRDTTGTDIIGYRVCFGGVVPCVSSTLTIELRAVPESALQFTVDSDRGFRDVPLSGLRALPSARFAAYGLVAPVIQNTALNDTADGSAPWGAGATATLLRRLSAGTAARDWRVLVDARGLAANDVDLFMGIDANGNGRADAAELSCSGAMTRMIERCDLALTAPAGGDVAYWVLLRSATRGDIARAEIFETPLDTDPAERTLAATGPGTVPAGASFPLRLVWNDPTFIPGESRGGWVRVDASATQTVDWVPVRIDRSGGEPAAYALQSGVDFGLTLPEGVAHERLYIDVPPGATQLLVTTTSAGAIDLYLAQVPTLTPTAATPIIAPAPPRAQATARATTPSGDERIVIANPTSGRWYVTPTNAPLGGTNDVIVRATVTGSGPQLAPGGYFNPERSGTGLFVYPAGGQWAGLFYTYLEDGTPTWYYLEDPAPGATGLWRGTIFRSAWNGSRNQLTRVGEATITPTSATAFTFSYTVDGQTGSEAYSNFSGACPIVGGAPLNLSGHWFDPARAGSGYTVQLFPNYEFHLVFGYDGLGQPRYLAAERSTLGGATETIPLMQVRGSCPLCTRGSEPQRTVVGTLTREISGGTLQRMQVNATYVDGVPGTWAANDAVIPLGNLRGCAAN